MAKKTAKKATTTAKKAAPAAKVTKTAAKTATSAKKATPAKKAASPRQASGVKKAASAKKTSAKKATTAGAKKAVKRKANPALMQPLQPDAMLSAIVGSKPAPRGQIVKKLWDYIKKNNLQDTKNKRQINADEKLKPIFNGKKQVSMFEMAKLVSAHIQ